MKYLLSLSDEIQERIRIVLGRGGYRDADELLLRAIDNQLKAELDDSNPWQASVAPIQESIQQLLPHTVVRKGESENLLSAPKRSPVLLELPSFGLISNKPLWGQYYKFLPSKVALRILTNLTYSSTVAIREFRETGALQAVELGRMLRNKDKKLGNKFGEELSTAFPDPKEKSVRRYQDQYMLYSKPDGQKITGLPAQMRWVNIDNKKKVGITKLGFEFAKLHNPVLDEDGSESLSQEEKECIIKHIVENLEAEAMQMEFVLDQLSSGVSSRNILNEKIGNFYRSHWTDSKSWNDAVINTMRSGVISRLFELGLLKKEKDGLMVSYLITEEGNRQLQILQRRIGSLLIQKEK